VNFINGSGKKTLFQHTYWTGKCPQAARTLWTAEIATGGRLKRNRNGITPLYGLSQPFAGIKTTEYFDPIPTSFYSKLTCKINAIVPIKIGHTYKINIPIDMEELFSFRKIYADKTGSYQSNHSICAHLRCTRLRSSAGNLSFFFR
jgi:hypothetical protein